MNQSSKTLQLEVVSKEGTVSVKIPTVILSMFAKLVTAFKAPLERELEKEGVKLPEGESVELWAAQLTKSIEDLEMQGRAGEDSFSVSVRNH